LEFILNFKYHGPHPSASPAEHATRRCPSCYAACAKAASRPPLPPAPIRTPPLSFIFSQLPSSRVGLLFSTSVTLVSYPHHSFSPRFGSASPRRNSPRGMPMHVLPRPTTGELQHCRRRLPPVSPTPSYAAKWGHRAAPFLVVLPTWLLAAGNAGAAGSPPLAVPRP
jgi:hypothetical protein